VRVGTPRVFSGATGNRTFLLRLWLTCVRTQVVALRVARTNERTNDWHVVQSIWNSIPILAGKLCYRVNAAPL
jgi:hypothetical protein